MWTKNIQTSSHSCVTALCTPCIGTGWIAHIVKQNSVKVHNNRNLVLFLLQRRCRLFRNLLLRFPKYVYASVGIENDWILSLSAFFQSVENSVCILHNLTYQLEAENPVCFENYQPRTQAQVESKKTSPIGCFSPKSSKAQKQVGISPDAVTVSLHPPHLLLFSVLLTVSIRWDSSAHRW